MLRILNLSWAIVLTTLQIALASGPAYQLTDLGTLPGGGQSDAYAINNNGQVVGRAKAPDGNWHAFLYDGAGPIRDLGTFGYSSSIAWDINDCGQIVGNSGAAFICTATSPMQALGTLPGGRGGAAKAINNGGQAVGTDVGAGMSLGHAVLYRGAGQVQDLGTLFSGNGYSTAVGINDAGQIVGYSNISSDAYGFVYSGDGPMQSLPISYPKDINDQGQVVGDSDLVYTIGGTAQHMGTPPEGWVHAFAINNLGQVVGQVSTGSAGPIHPFLYSSSGPMQDLRDLVDPNGYTLLCPYDINDSGWIVGSMYDPAGEIHAFLLTPVPEPSALAVLAVGGLALVRRRGRR